MTSINPYEELKRIRRDLDSLILRIHPIAREELMFVRDEMGNIEYDWSRKRNNVLRVRLSLEQKKQIDMVGREKEREVLKRKRGEEVIDEEEQVWVTKKKTRRSLSSDEEDEIEESVEESEESEVEEELEEIEESEDEEDITPTEVKKTRKIVININ